MPFVVKGKCVYRRTSSGLVKKGCSKSNEAAKKYKKKLDAVSHDKK